ncbi:hypothetical protein HD597_001224 [Nonomuraea thailandensis]|uniref:Uncharacterized protein n=1 Tax=Nonomuraea thailandensis TaxID=1188745 RepID=A0A9X2JZH5_9ACTN|nr:hypothetical protein [Nonomuraea thailandensis]MCP2354204.1 hypothetical protein [Nonomuraea thailandensis]
MGAELATLVGELSPYVTAAVGAYGATVLARAQEEAADATVGWGRRMLQQIFGVRPDEDDVPETVIELAQAPDDPDLQAALRVQIRRLMAADEELAARLRAMVAEARAETAGTVTVTASGDHSAGFNH